MSTVYVAIPQPLTTKYLKKGGSGDIDQLVEDVEQLKTEVGQIEEVDDEQNTDITTLKSDVSTLQSSVEDHSSNILALVRSDIQQNTNITNLQTSDTAQNVDLDKLRHQIILIYSYYDDVLNYVKKNLNYDGKIITPESDILDVSNIPNLKMNICAFIGPTHGGNPGRLVFNKRENVNQCLNNYYYLYPLNSNFLKSGFMIVNGLGENVLANNKTIKEADVANGVITLPYIMNNYGTDYYKAHQDDTFDYSLLDANVEVITNIKQWMTDKLSTSDFESMTNLKTWVESKAGGGTPTTILKVPVDVYVSNTGENGFNASHQVPLRISTASYKLPGENADSTGYYIAFHSSTTAPYHINSISIVGLIQGAPLPTLSYDSLCRFYKTDFTFSHTDYDKYGRLNFIMNDGTTCYEPNYWRAFYDVDFYCTHFISDVINFDQLKNNVCKISNDEIVASTYQYTTSNFPYYKFNGNEGSMLTPYQIQHTDH